ncbi:MlaD family protein [Chitinophaga ginsengisoli]|uniref:Phospholipid/cholesterol/gamma-HCH transport system substrate-binding protein n=1 Tax=Chitinophaga ginsengisoli TaxID=363837 RepID=A0A2P8G4G9_9BACT|nr:MlaD family protein [Chitinophaga ginsengisoli]PSL28873.1 phospholipid/cholesterol/gamma-HCH transport system substrate-binding protein [Chitinophaga ginsengisoli]
MQQKRQQKIKVGIFATVTLGLLLVGIFLIGRNRSLFQRTFVLYGTFKNVGGLQAGNNVRFVGIDVGTVESIDILSDTTARVALRIKEKVKPFIKRGAIAGISTDGLMGDKLITISSGTENGTPVKDKDTIRTVDPMNYDRVLDRLSGVAENAEVITEQLAGIATQINQGKGSIGRLLYSDSLATSLEGTVTEARTTVKSIRKGSEGFSENMEALKHNFLLRGYYKKKEKAAKKEAEEQKKAAERGKKAGKDSSSLKVQKE